MSYPIGMTCQELVELVTEYLEGTLAVEMRARFEDHLAVCPGCRDYLEQMRRTIAATGHLSEESLEPATRDQMLALFNDWKRTG
jgi:predicted anti-sigma-YlaC factor YlaD